jgi:hypothetical protein
MVDAVGMVIEDLETCHPRVQRAVQDAEETRRVVAPPVDETARGIPRVRMFSDSSAED